MGRDWENGNMFLKVPEDDALHIDLVEEDMIKYEF